MGANPIGTVSATVSLCDRIPGQGIQASGDPNAANYFGAENWT